MIWGLIVYLILCVIALYAVYTAPLREDFD